MKVDIPVEHRIENNRYEFRVWLRKGRWGAWRPLERWNRDFTWQAVAVQQTASVLGPIEGQDDD